MTYVPGKCCRSLKVSLSLFGCFPIYAYLNAKIAGVKPGEKTTWERWHPPEADEFWNGSWEQTQQQAWASQWQQTQHQAWAPTQHGQWEETLPDYHAWAPTQHQAWGPTPGMGSDQAWEATQRDDMGSPTHHQGK